MKRIILTFLMSYCLFLNSSESVSTNYFAYNNVNIDNMIAVKLSVMTKLMYIESRFDSTAYNVVEDAVGVLQIRRILVDDVNRLLGFKKYKYSDRKSVKQSMSIFLDYQDLYNKDFNVEKAVRIWNGGPLGHKKTKTITYYRKFLKMNS